MGGNNGFDGKPNNDYRVKIQLDDTQSGVLKEKLKAAHGSGITLNVVDGGEDVGKVLEIDFDANNIALETKIVGGNNISVTEGTGAQAGKLVISETEVGKVLVDSNDTTLKYLDDAITSSDNSITHEVSGNKEDLTVPNLGKVKVGDTFGYLGDKLIGGYGVNVETEGDNVYIDAETGELFEGVGIEISDLDDADKRIAIKPSDFVSHTGIAVEEGTGDDSNKIVIEKWQDIAFTDHGVKIQGDPDDFTPSYLNTYAATYVKTLIPDSGSADYIGVGFYSGFEGFDGTISLRIYYKNSGINAHTFDIKEINGSYSLAQIVFPVQSGYIDVNIDASDIAHNELFLIPTVEATENQDITIYRIMFLKL